MLLQGTCACEYKDCTLLPVTSQEGTPYAANALMNSHQLHYQSQGWAEFASSITCRRAKLLLEGNDIVTLATLLPRDIVNKRILINMLSL